MTEDKEFKELQKAMERRDNWYFIYELVGERLEKSQEKVDEHGLKYRRAVKKKIKEMIENETK
jgi:hypothetical protein